MSAANIGVMAVLLLAAALRLWRLDQNGYDNQYYSAAVRSMADNWHNFLYNSFDPAGFVSVDKPPAALWVQVASVKLFGFHELSILLPQVLEGLATVWLLYHLVQRPFGAAAGLLAGLFLAVTPVSVAIDRSSNTDTCLVLVLLLGAWALTRAAEAGCRRLLLLSMALVGLAFNVKMLAAFVVLPAFALVYLLGAPVPWRRRLVDGALGALVLAAVSLPWVVAYDLTPSDKRPFAGSSQQNSMVDLAIGHNGIGRFARFTRPARPGGADPGIAQPPTVETRSAAGAEPAQPAGPRSGWARILVRVPVGPLRLADGQLAGQVGWLFPLAVMGLAAGALHARRQRPVGPAHLALVLWAGWALAYGIVYSYAGGIFHFYYLGTMAPPLAALAGIGVVGLWSWYLRRGWRAILLPAALLLTAAWQIHIESSAIGWKPDAIGWKPDDGSGASLIWMSIALIAGTLVAAAGLLLMSSRESWSRPVRPLAAGALGVGLLALLVTPMAWALSSVLVKGIAIVPSADVARLISAEAAGGARGRGRSTGPLDTRKLVEFLEANRRGERYLLGTSSATLAAPIIVDTGGAAIARGGFHGLDPILTPEGLARMVEARQIRFVMLGDLSIISRRMGAEEAGRPVADWIRANGKLVDPTLWRSGVQDGQRGRSGGMRLYDLAPEAAIVPAR